MSPETAFVASLFLSALLTITAVVLADRDDGDARWGT